MASNFVEAPKPTRKFNRRKDDMFLERDLPERAVKALEVIGKICDQFDTLVTGAGSDDRWTFTYTINQARKAYAEGIAYGHDCRKAYLPPVIRHLMVQVAKDFKNPVPVVQEFTNNKRFMQLLDKAWS